MQTDIHGCGKSLVLKSFEGFDKISVLIDSMNQQVLGYLGVKLEQRKEYAIEYVSQMLEIYKETTGLDESSLFLDADIEKHSPKQYEELQGYLERLKTTHNI